MSDHEPGETRGPWARHDMIAAYLRHGIYTGDYPPGSNLPPTRLLRERFDAAPQTIKNATGILAEEGLVYSRPGRGIVVREHARRVMTPAAYKDPAERGEPYRWLGEAERRGSPGRSHLLHVEEVVPPADVRALLGLPDGHRAQWRQQVLYLGDDPAELVSTYYPLGLAAGTGLTEKRRIQGGAPRLLEDLGYPTLKCVDVVSSMQPTPEQCEALGMATRVPVLRTLRQTLSTGGLVIEVADMAKASSLYEIRYEF